MATIRIVWTQADLDRIDRAIADGGIMQSITFADQTYTFRSLDEMLRLRAIIAGALNAAAGTSSTRFAATSKGV
jgi:hypothetical protein